MAPRRSTLPHENIEISRQISRVILSAKNIEIWHQRIAGGISGIISVNNRCGMGKNGGGFQQQISASAGSKNNKIWQNLERRDVMGRKTLVRIRPMNMLPASAASVWRGMASADGAQWRMARDGVVISGDRANVLLHSPALRDIAHHLACCPSACSSNGKASRGFAISNSTTCSAKKIMK